MNAVKEKVQEILNAKAPPALAVWAMVGALSLCALGTTLYWGNLYVGNEMCVECVPIGLSTFRFLHWPFCDFFMDFLYIATAIGLVRKSKFVYLSGVTLGFMFILMGVLGAYSTFIASEPTEQPFFLDAYFVGFGGLLLALMHHWRGHWSSTAQQGLPTRKRGAI
mmetsp:Transcript_11876/g.23312  ORF Transcript_11876/g.23312 Transcript_11876/m.23312 type:complete len:165 (+) Transcript_11876:163-657(+)|eukprot:CAMPEP_0171486436 /NCGR_PEP_ID=MMETSP0958-20121227/1092_1 /TAXON_ID=87120 /ORGANISM="Aurantiochytrium limacinum, Strain ATCCMYA-1381" /LENGTH=164 /DNA_ID=CAMNT_0012019321 /DNA_START=129 /DNA_END=623 /DNA_ORIENTATION=+